MAAEVAKFTAALDQIFVRVDQFEKIGVGRTHLFFKDLTKDLQKGECCGVFCACRLRKGADALAQLAQPSIDTHLLLPSPFFSFGFDELLGLLVLADLLELLLVFVDVGRPLGVVLAVEWFDPIVAVAEVFFACAIDAAKEGAQKVLNADLVVGKLFLHPTGLCRPDAKHMKAFVWTVAVDVIHGGSTNIIHKFAVHREKLVIEQIAKTPTVLAIGGFVGGVGGFLRGGDGWEAASLEKRTAVVEFVPFIFFDVCVLGTLHQPRAEVAPYIVGDDSLGLFEFVDGATKRTGVGDLLDAVADPLDGGGDIFGFAFGAAFGGGTQTVGIMGFKEL